MSIKINKLLTLLLALVVCTASTLGHANDNGSVFPNQHELIDKWGVEALRVTLSANDYMVDFRYKVHDPEKAAKVVNRKDQPFIQQSSTGLTRLVPAPANIGSLRHTGRNLKRDRNYFVLFANPGKKLKKGDKINLVMGDYKLENVIIQ